LPADFGGMSIWIEARGHLLIRMDVVPKIPQSMTEFLHIFSDQIQVSGNIDKIVQSPVLKRFYLACFVFWTEGGLVEVHRLCAGNTQKYSLKRLDQLSIPTGIMLGRSEKQGDHSEKAMEGVIGLN
jgi:hypothetical protein